MRNLRLNCYLTGKYCTGYLQVVINQITWDLYIIHYFLWKHFYVLVCYNLILIFVDWAIISGLINFVLTMLIEENIDLEGCSITKKSDWARKTSLNMWAQSCHKWYNLAKYPMTVWGCCATFQRGLCPYHDLPMPPSADAYIFKLIYSVI